MVKVGEWAYVNAKLVTAVTSADQGKSVKISLVGGDSIMLEDLVKDVTPARAIETLVKYLEEDQQ